MLKYERHLSFWNCVCNILIGTLNNMYDGLDGVVFNLYVLSQIRLCTYPYRCWYVVFVKKIFIYTLHPGCLDSYYGQCRLEAFAVPMFCFLLQNTTEAKSYWTSNNSNIQCETVSDAPCLSSIELTVCTIFMVVIWWCCYQSLFAYLSFLFSLWWFYWRINNMYSHSMALCGPHFIFVCLISLMMGMQI